MRKTLGIFLVLVGLYLILILLKEDTFLSGPNQRNLWRQVALLAIFAIGEGFVIICGGIDLSVGALIAYTGMLAAHMMVDWHLPPAVAVVLVLGFAGIVGAVHGQLVTRFKLPSFIVTLSSLMVFRGLSLLMKDGTNIGFGTGFEDFRALGRDYAPLILLAVAAVAHFILHHTVMGQYFFAVGNNPEAARYSGIDVDRVVRRSFLISSLLAGVGGLLYAGYLPATGPRVAPAYELYAIAAVVLGGCSLSGGVGSILGIIIGAAIIRTLGNGILLVLLGSASFHEKWIIGVVILIAVILDTALKRARAPTES